MLRIKAHVIYTHRIVGDSTNSVGIYSHTDEYGMEKNRHIKFASKSDIVWVYYDCKRWYAGITDFNCNKGTSTVVKFKKHIANQYWNHILLWVAINCTLTKLEHFVTLNVAVFSFACMRWIRFSQRNFFLVIFLLYPYCQLTGWRQRERKRRRGREEGREMWCEYTLKSCSVNRIKNSQINQLFLVLRFCSFRFP